MADLSDAATALMKYWGNIASSVTQRATTAQLWSSLRSALDEAGEPLPEGAFAGVNELRSYATSIRNAAATLAGLPADAAIDSSVIAEAPWAKPLAAQAAAPEWQINFQAVVEGPNGPATEWRTLYSPITLPATVGDLEDFVGAGAEAMSLDYGVSITPIGGYQILTI